MSLRGLFSVLGLSLVDSLTFLSPVLIWKLNIYPQIMFIHVRCVLSSHSIHFQPHKQAACVVKSNFCLHMMVVAQHGTSTSVQSNPVSVVTSVSMPCPSGMPVQHSPVELLLLRFLQNRMSSTSDQVSLEC